MKRYGNMKNKQGFTLIELVVVIVILGILAVTAAPKFLNLQDDAKISALKGLEGAIKGATGIVYGKAAVSGVENQQSAILVLNGVSTPIRFGYPLASSASLGAVVDGLYDGDWDIQAHAGIDVQASYGFKNFECRVNYLTALDENTAPEIKIIGTAQGCPVTP